MITLVFYVSLCTSNLVCNSYEPASWTYSNEEEREEAYQNCQLLVNTFDALPETKETDCYIEE